MPDRTLDLLKNCRDRQPLASVMLPLAVVEAAQADGCLATHNAERLRRSGARGTRFGTYF